MKKAMILAAALMCAFAANATWVKWGAASATSIDSAKITSGTMYLMYTSGTADFTAFNGQSTFTADSLAAAGFTKTIDSFAYSATTFNKSTKDVNPTSTGLAAGTYSLYTILVSEDGKYVAYGASPQSVPINAMSSMMQTKVTSNFTYVEAASAPTPAVPEPTSGVLMLVGMGVLALRRKRA